MERVETSPDDYIAIQGSDIRTVLEQLHTLITLPAKTPCFSLGDVGGLPFLW